MPQSYTTRRINKETQNTLYNLLFNIYYGSHSKYVTDVLALTSRAVKNQTGPVVGSPPIRLVPPLPVCGGLHIPLTPHTLRQPLHGFGLLSASRRLNSVGWCRDSALLQTPGTLVL